MSKFVGLIIYGSHPFRIAVTQCGDRDPGAEVKVALSICIKYGGSLSGEHGIGLEKAPWKDSIYSSADLENMKRVRNFFNPDELLNPGKIFPHPGRCAEVKKQEKAQTELDHTRIVAAKTGIAV